MEEPASILIEEYQETPDESFLHLEKKEYPLKINNLEYKLKIFYNKNKIIFKLKITNIYCYLIIKKLMI